MKMSDYFITEEMYMVDVMKRLNVTEKGILYVVDDQNRLLGSITDGDIRRSIIDSGRLDRLAREIMNTNPVYICLSEKDTAEYVMDKYIIHSVPIVDDDNRIVDIRFDDNRKIEYSSNKIDVPVVIMAGGKGTRLRPYTSILPKPLIPIGEKTITEHIIERFKDAGCNEFSIIVNYKKHLIKAYFRDNKDEVNIKFIEEKEYLGTSGGLRLLLGKYKEAFFVTNCDILLEADYADIYKYHCTSRNIATVVCAVKKTTLPYGVISSTKSGRITSIQEKPDISSVVNTGFYVIEPEFLKIIPEGRVSHITDIFQECIKNGLRVGMYPVSENCWMDMGQLDELKKMEERLEELK